MSEVTDALRALQAGDRTIEDVQTMFTQRRWSPPPSRTPGTAEELAAQEQGDRDPDPEGSFAEVAQAFYLGIITVDQYEVLATAAAGAMKANAEEPEADPEADTETDENEPETESEQVSEGAEGDTSKDTEEES